MRDPLHQTGKYVNQEIELYFIVKLCLLDIRTKRWVMCCITRIQASARKALENVVEGDWEECRASPLVAFNSNMRCMKAPFDVASS